MRAPVPVCGVAQPFRGTRRAMRSVASAWGPCAAPGSDISLSPTEMRPSSPSLPPQHDMPLGTACTEQPSATLYRTPNPSDRGRGVGISVKPRAVGGERPLLWWSLQMMSGIDAGSEEGGTGFESEARRLERIAV